MERGSNLKEGERDGEKVMIPLLGRQGYFQSFRRVIDNRKRDVEREVITGWEQAPP